MLVKRGVYLSLALAVALTLAACVPGTATPTTPATLPPATVTAETAATTAAPDTAGPPTATAPAPATATAEPTPIPLPDYLDDRSSAAAVLASYVNALNRREYARAYGYWDQAAAVEAFEAFQAGYADTAQVSLETGPQGTEGAVGTLHHTVAVTLRATLTDGPPQTFVGCYTLYQVQPANQGTPPFRPIGLASAAVAAVAADADTAALMAAACPPPAAAVTPAPTPPPGDISSAHFIDNRSTPADLLRSLFNAINRHEYLRAYSYWKEGALSETFEAFEAGYTGTAHITELVVGDAPPDPGAGQINYLAPVTVRADTIGGAQQTYVGCYRLHLSNPGIQIDPPFVPLGIQAARLELVANDADTATLMASACATPPQ